MGDEDAHTQPAALWRERIEKIGFLRVSQFLGASTSPRAEHRSYVFHIADRSPSVPETERNRVLKILPRARAEQYGFDPVSNRDSVSHLAGPGFPTQYNVSFYDERTDALSSRHTCTHFLLPFEHLPNHFSVANTAYIPTEESLFPFLWQSARLVQRLHERKLIHGDRKPSNELASGKRIGDATSGQMHVAFEQPALIDFETVTPFGEPLRYYSPGYCHPLLEKHGADPAFWRSRDALRAHPALEVIAEIRLARKLARRVELEARSPFDDLSELEHACIVHPQDDKYTMQSYMTVLHTFMQSRRWSRRVFVGSMIAAVVAPAVVKAYAIRREQLTETSGNAFLDTFSGSPADERRLYELLAARVKNDVSDGKYPAMRSINGQDTLSTGVELPTVIQRERADGTNDTTDMSYEYGGANTHLLFLAAQKEPSLSRFAQRYAETQLQTILRTPAPERFVPGDGKNLFLAPFLFAAHAAEQSANHTQREAFLRMICQAADTVCAYLEHGTGAYPYIRERTFQDDQPPDRLAATDARIVYHLLLPASRARALLGERGEDPYLRAAIAQCRALGPLSTREYVMAEMPWSEKPRDLVAKITSSGQAVFTRALAETAAALQAVPGKRSEAAEFRNHALGLLQNIPDTELAAHYLLEPPSRDNPVNSHATVESYVASNLLGAKKNYLRALVPFIPREELTIFGTRRPSTALLTHMCMSLRDSPAFWCYTPGSGSPKLSQALMHGLWRNYYGTV